MNLADFTKFVSLDLRGRSGRRPADDDRRLHLDEAMAWMCRAQDAYAPGGVALDYSLRRGWAAGYPETTGYIIETFVKYAALAKNDEYLKRAIRMADWELSIQNADGSFNGGPWGATLGSFVFDTGQIVFGLIEAHKLTGDEKYLRAAVRAGDWLVKVQDPEGMWKLHTYNQIPHAYYTRVAWGLAELGAHTKDDRYSTAAARNVDWAIRQQLPNGWFGNAGFTVAGHQSPFTHTIAYTIEGVLETGARLGRADHIDAAQRAADSLLPISRNGFFAGTYRSDWSSTEDSACLTGCAQIACIFLRLYELRQQARYLAPAQQINRFVCSCQETSGSPETRGAISGSYPIWGAYLRYTFPNWAAKFFADALLLELRLTRSLDTLTRGSAQ